MAQQAILENIEKFMAGWNDNDPVAHTAMFAQNSSFVDIDGNLLHGLNEITKHEAEARTDRYHDSLVRTMNVSIRFIRSDVAIVHLSWEMIRTFSVDGSDALRLNGMFTFVMSTEADRWLIDAAHNTYSRSKS